MQQFNPGNSAIQNVGYGSLEKVYISFSSSFWVGAGGEEQTRNGPGFCQWLSPTYASDTNPACWTVEGVELGSPPLATAHATLLFYVYGDQGSHLISQTRKLAAREEQEAFLYAYFKPYYALLPNYDDQSPGCKPVACAWTDWLHDDLAGNGSYTNFQVGLIDGDADICAMREGLPDRGLYFAGEHTSPFVALGTATGAYWSGELVAGRLAEAHGKQKVK